jgi:hypothetical protein
MRADISAVRRYITNHRVEFEITRHNGDEPLRFSANTKYAGQLAELLAELDDDKLEVLPVDEAAFLGWDEEQILERLGSDWETVNNFNRIYRTI